MRKKMPKKQIEKKEPDIAFYFDEKDPMRYEIMIVKNLTQIHLIQACFDLLAKAIRSDDDTLQAEWDKTE